MSFKFKLNFGLKIIFVTRIHLKKKFSEQPSAYLNGWGSVDALWNFQISLNIHLAIRARRQHELKSFNQSAAFLMQGKIDLKSTPWLCSRYDKAAHFELFTFAMLIISFMRQDDLVSWANPRYTGRWPPIPGSSVSDYQHRVAQKDRIFAADLLNPVGFS